MTTTLRATDLELTRPVPGPHLAAVSLANERPIGRYDYEDGSYIKIVAGGDVDTETALEMVETLIDLKRKELARRKKPVSGGGENSEFAVAAVSSETEE